MFYNFLINYGYEILCVFMFLIGLWYSEIKSESVSVRCINCGATLKKGSKFCAKCGEKA
jgi:predicted amidophosphoribosyltransferase